MDFIRLLDRNFACLGDSEVTVSETHWIPGIGFGYSFRNGKKKEKKKEGSHAPAPPSAIPRFQPPKKPKPYVPGVRTVEGNVV